MSTDENARFLVTMTRAQRRRLKMAAAAHDSNMSDYAMEAILAKLDADPLAPKDEEEK